MLEGCFLPISNSEKKLTKKERLTKIPILWTPGLLEEQNQEGCNPQCLCRLQYDTQLCQASLRLSGPLDHNDTVSLWSRLPDTVWELSYVEVRDPG